jgi:hypothetical protein
MKIILIFLNIIWLTGLETPQTIQLTKDSNFKLDGFNVRETYIINEKEKFIIASKITNDKTDYKGLKFLYYINNNIKFSSTDVGESYFYRPTFYQFQDGTLLIVCEKGFEYFAGIDIFQLSHGNVNMLGNIDIASATEDNSSIIPNLLIERLTDNYYDFKFKGKVVVNPGGTESNEINGDSLLAKYHPETGKISLMIKSN